MYFKLYSIIYFKLYSINIFYSSLLCIFYSSLLCIFYSSFLFLTSIPHFTILYPPLTLPSFTPPSLYHLYPPPSTLPSFTPPHKYHIPSLSIQPNSILKPIPSNRSYHLQSIIYFCIFPYKCLLISLLTTITITFINLSLVHDCPLLSLIFTFFKQCQSIKAIKMTLLQKGNVIEKHVHTCHAHTHGMCYGLSALIGTRISFFYQRAEQKIKFT
ncbi:hypothetical protein VCUG_02297 [Vavraia culicis subsp. floridensis]|uniref:Uncharacterized protein n=1 Tax=Vavraia culicis (isolate floridensis) TaxID=948595 RepID=L2GRD2_VAVCU|nr:uncharacterized protein VCUG_02297 [Vavraia culicis subsp. floridensis]ELA46216.1 hypothetical protein VCUG_02297 [Vavraia culicis subsp. floridensis]